MATIFTRIHKPRETSAHLQATIARHGAQQAWQIPLPTKEKIVLQGIQTSAPSAIEALIALVEDADADLLAVEAAADLVGVDFCVDEEAAAFMDSWLAELLSHELSI